MKVTDCLVDIITWRRPRAKNAVALRCSRSTKGEMMYEQVFETAGSVRKRRLEQLVTRVHGSGRSVF